ncbi:MAG: hypothetical protein CMM25_05925 [Rhodospirillaceae bacterium]|nr:hypothetical protein [Rhodospirillaceae bacterium]
MMEDLDEFVVIDSPDDLIGGVSPFYNLFGDKLCIPTSDTSRLYNFTKRFGKHIVLGFKQFQSPLISITAGRTGQLVINSEWGTTPRSLKYWTYRDGWTAATTVQIPVNNIVTIPSTRK